VSSRTYGSGAFRFNEYLRHNDTGLGGVFNKQRTSNRRVIGVKIVTLTS
jgi:hypothetical protein